MTVGELRALLAEYPDGMRVVVEGYEDGLNDVTVGPAQVVDLGPSDEWWSGRYQPAREYPDRAPFGVVALGRARRPEE